nr:14665_t:CDS:2 [Entrophospora candida]
MIVNVSTPYATGMGRRVLSLMYAMTCIQHCVLYPVLLRKCLVYTSLQCKHFALSWEMYPMTTGRVVEAILAKVGNYFENPPSYNEEEPKSQKFTEYDIIEELTFDLCVAMLLPPYRKILEEMRNHHVEEEPQQAQHLSSMLKWSFVENEYVLGKFTLC